MNISFSSSASDNMRFILAFSLFIAVTLAGRRISPPAGAITVGSGGTYSTVSCLLRISHLLGH